MTIKKASILMKSVFEGSMFVKSAWDFTLVWHAYRVAREIILMKLAA